MLLKTQPRFQPTLPLKEAPASTLRQRTGSTPATRRRVHACSKIAR
jgi:hypothetical protein